MGRVMSFENQEIVLQMHNKDRVNTKGVTHLPLFPHALCLHTPRHFK